MLDQLLAHWPLKLLALVLAVALWAVIMGEDRLSRDLSVPLEARIPERNAFLKAPPNSVSVRLVGPESLISKIEPYGLGVDLDLEEVTPGTRDIRLTEDDLVGLPAGVSVAFFTPERVSVEIDRKRKNDIPVRARFVGDPPDGYHIYSVRLGPKTVPVEGPESAINTLTEVFTDPIQVGHRTRAFDDVVAAVPDVPGVQLIDPTVLVEVHVVIDESPEKADLSDVPIIVASPRYAATATRTVLEVEISGPPGLLGELTPEHIRAVAEIGEDLGPGTHRVPVRAEIVDRSEDDLDCLSIESIKPQRISVRLTEVTAEPS